MPRVVHFDISADDPERASEFYSKTFGWKISKWEGPMDYWLVMTGEGSPGIDGGIGRRMDPSDTITNTIDVPSVEEYQEKILANGGTLVMQKTVIPGVGYMAVFKDTEGNPFGIMQSNESAQ